MGMPCITNGGPEQPGKRSSLGERGGEIVQTQNGLSKCMDTLYFVDIGII